MALDPLTNVNQSISEVEAAQDPLSAFNRLFSEVNTGIPTNPYPVISAPIPRTTSNAVDINQNLVGNEVTGPAPGVNNTTPQGNKSFTDAALDYMDDAENWAKDEYKYGRTYSYGAGWRNMQFERFYTHPNYKKLGFSPYRDNEELYNENSTWADDWRRSSSQYWKLLSNAFGSSIYGSDDFKAAETMQEGLALGSSSKEGIGSSITNFGLSSMYTLGIGAEMLAENAVLYAVEAGAIALAPETFGATLPLAAAAATKQAASAGKFIKAIENTYTFLKGLKQAQTVKEFYNASKIGQAGIAAAKFLNPLENTYQFTSFLAKGEKVWTSTEKLALAAHGFGHFFKDLRMISLGVEESGLEGAMARSEYHQKLIDEYYAKYGRMPEGQDAQEIYQKAASVDFTVSMANLPAIFLTNKIFFGKYLRGFPTLSSIAKTVEKDSTRYLVGVGAGKVLEKGAYEYAEKSAGRKAAEFFLSSPYLPWSREYFVTNLPEALQENLQDAISSSVIAYHEKIDKDPSVAGFWEGMSQFGTSVKGQLTGQGLETFLSGYFTGTLMGGISGPTIGIFETIASRTKSGKDKVEAAKERRKVREEAIKDAVNGMAMDAVNVGERNATTASKVKNYMDEADKAADERNEYKYKSAVDAAFASKAYTLAATDKTKLFTDHIDEMLTLEDEDLAKAYNMPVAEAQDVRRRLNNAKQRALDVKDTYEIVKKEYPNPVDLSLIDRKKNEDLYKKMLAKYHAHEFAIETITTSTEALRRTNGRLIGIVNEFSQASPWLSLRRGAQEVKDAGASDITALLDNYQRQRLIETLELEVDTLKEGTPEQKKKAKLKQTKIDELKKWNDIAFKFTLIAKAREEAFRNKNVDLTGVNKLINNLTSEMYPIFDKYTKIIAEEQGGTLMSKELGKAFTKVRDYHLLDSDSNAYTKALNILNDPLYFDRYISAIETAQEQLQATKAERIVEGYKKFLDLKDSNDLLNAIYDQGLFVIPENVEEFLKNPRTAKFELYDIASKEPIAPGNPKYEAFQNILNDRYPVEEVVTEEVKTEVVEEEAPAQKAISVVDDINTMPKELQEELIKKYESLKTYFAEERPDVKFPYYNFDQFLKRSPEAKQIIEAYNKKNNLKPAPAETKAGVFTPTTPYGTPKGPELTTTTKPEAPVSDAAKKADIERRRQEELEYWQAEDRQKRIKEGRETTKKVLENLKKKYPATTIQGIAIRLLEKIIDLNTFAIINSEGLKLPGGQDATSFGALATGEGMAMRQDRIDALLTGDVNAVKTFIHELVHTFTKEKVGEYRMEKSGLIPGYKAKLTEKEKQAVAELERIYNKVKAQFPSSTEYGLTNLDEFLAEAFSNGSFQGTLSEIKAEGKKTSLFKEWLNAVADLFYAGLEKWAKRFNKEIPSKSEVNGILEDVMAWTEDLIDDKLIKLEVTTEEINAKYDAELAALEGAKPKAPVSDIEAKKAEGTNNDGSVYKSTTTEKDGIIKTNYEGYRESDGKKLSLGGRKLTKERFLSEYQINEDGLDLLDGVEQIVIREIRNNKGKLGISVRLRFAEGWMDAELAALERAKPVAKPVEEVKVVEFKVGDRVKINTEKDGEGIIKEDRGDKVLLQDGRQVAKKNLLPIEEKPVVEPNLIPEVTTATYEQVIKLLENLNEKDLIVSDDETIYINRDNPNDVFDRISSLTKKKEFKDKRDAKRGTIIDDLFRRFINPEGDIKTEGDLILAYSKHPKKSQAQKFENSFLKGLYKIFNDIKTIAEKENLSLIANTKPLWGVLNGTKYAGAMDILAVNKNTGKVYIVDLKTSSLNRREEYIKEEAFRELAGDLYQDMKIKISEADNNILAVKNFTKEEIAVADKFLEDYPGFETKKGAQVSPIYFYSDSDTTQQSGYAELLRQRTGINVANILTFPIQTTKSADKSTYLLAKPLVDKNSKFTLQVNVDKELAPEQKLPAGSVEHIEPLIVEEAPETYISIRQDRYNELVVELDELGNQLIKFGKDPSIYEGVKSIKEEAEIMAINGNLTSKQANNLTKIINNILLNYKNIDLIEKGDIIIFTANPDIEYEVVDRTKKELKYYAKSLSFEERNITAPESISATEIFKIKSVIKPGEIVKQEPLTPEEKEINSNNVQTVDAVLADEQTMRKAFETKKSDNQIDDEWNEGLIKCTKTTTETE